MTGVMVSGLEGLPSCIGCRRSSGCLINRAATAPRGRRMGAAQGAE